jgi:hypothetical protein
VYIFALVVGLYIKAPITRLLSEITSTPFPSPHEHRDPTFLNLYHGSYPPRRSIRGIHSHKQCHRQLSDQSPTLTHKGAFYAQQQQQQQQPPTYTQIQYFRPSLPVGSEMPDEWGYPPSSTPQVSSVPFSHVHGLCSPASLASTDIPRNTQGVLTLPTGSAPRGGVPQSHPPAGAAAMVPTCRHPNCRHPVSRDERTQELTEYCSLDHMRFVSPVCTAPRAVCFFFFFCSRC